MYASVPEWRRTVWACVSNSTLMLRRLCVLQGINIVTVIRKLQSLHVSDLKLRTYDLNLSMLGWISLTKTDKAGGKQAQLLLISVDTRFQKLDILDKLRQDVQDLEQTCDFYLRDAVWMYQQNHRNPRWWCGEKPWNGSLSKHCRWMRRQWGEKPVLPCTQTPAQETMWRKAPIISDELCSLWPKHMTTWTVDTKNKRVLMLPVTIMMQASIPANNIIMYVAAPRKRCALQLCRLAAYMR